jgi:outer membrane lipoprotein-sorting protein
MVDKSSYRIVALQAADRQGGHSIFLFTNFKENIGVSDKTFEFKIPRGADVITTGSTTR